MGPAKFPPFSIALNTCRSNVDFPNFGCDANSVRWPLRHHGPHTDSASELLLRLNCEILSGSGKDRPSPLAPPGSLYTTPMPKNLLSKSVRERLQEEGRWEAFCLLRESLKADGMEARDAITKAMEEFQPLDPDYQTPPGPNPARQPGALSATPAKERVPLTVFKGRTCDIRVAIEWVADHIMISDVKAADAPSSAAWGLIKWAQRTQQNEAEFWKNLFKPLIPPISTEEEGRFVDDGHEILDTITQRLKALNPPREAGRGETDQEADGEGGKAEAEV